MFSPAIVGKRPFLRETRPLSAGGERGELSHHALEDRHQGGAKSGALRKRYTALLREEVGRAVSDPAEIDEEFHALCDALVASEGRLGP